MKKIVRICVAVLSVLSAGVRGQENPIQEYPLEFSWQQEIAAKSNKNIKDYFLLLPSTHIDCEGAQFGAFSTKIKRERLIKKVDLKNGYLAFGNSAQLALFKDRENKKDIIAIQVGGCGAGNTCGSLNTVMELEDGKWKFRVDLLPMAKTLEELYYSDNVCPYFELPQFGKIILVRNELENQTIISKYIWNNHRFIFAGP